MECTPFLLTVGENSSTGMANSKFVFSYVGNKGFNFRFKGLTGMYTFRPIESGEVIVKPGSRDSQRIRIPTYLSYPQEA